MFVAECAKAGGAQKKILSTRGANAEPLSCKHSQEMAAGKKEHGSLDGSHPAHYPARARAYLVGRFASWAPVAEKLPVRAQGVNLGRRTTFIFAVIPFDQVGIDFGLRAKTGELAGPVCAFQGTGKNASELQ